MENNENKVGADVQETPVAPEVAETGIATEAAPEVATPAEETAQA